LSNYLIHKFIDFILRVNVAVHLGGRFPSSDEFMTISCNVTPPSPLLACASKLWGGMGAAT